MRNHAEKEMHRVRKRIRDAADDFSLLPPEEILPDVIMKTIVDRFYDITDVTSLVHITDNYPPLQDHYSTLLACVDKLRLEFEEMRSKAKAESAAKRRETAARKKAEALETGAASTGEDSNQTAEELTDDQEMVADGNGETDSDSDAGVDPEIDDGEEVIPKPLTIIIPGGRFQREPQ